MGSDFKPRRTLKIAGAAGTTGLTTKNDTLGKKRKKRRYVLEQLIVRITESNRHGEINWGLPVGSEVW